MRGLFIGSYPNQAEPYRSVFFRELIYEMAKQGVECTVISCVSLTAYRGRTFKVPEYSVEVLDSGEKIEVYRPRIVSYSAKKIGKWNTIHLTQKSIEHAVFKTVKKLDSSYDFVYGHFFIGGGLTAAKVAQKYGLSAYIAYGECDFQTEVANKYGAIKASDMRGVRGIVAVSSYNKNDVEHREFASGIPVLLSVNSINTEIFRVKNKEKCREKLGLPKDEFIVGFVGYFIERKGPKRVLEACKGLQGVKLAFAGKGDDAPNGDNVVFCKSLPHDDVSEFLNAVDIFVLPTLHEGCCNAVIEAMACGKSIISSRLPFNMDILNDKNSILIDPMNVSEIRQAVIELRDNEILRNRIAGQALEDAKHLSITHRAHNILRFINETSGND